MLVAVGCQGFLPPKHGPAKPPYVHGAEIKGQQHGPSQLAPEVGPAPAHRTHEKDRVDHTHVGIGRGERHEETGHHRDSETDQFQGESPGI